MWSGYNGLAAVLGTGNTMVSIARCDTPGLSSLIVKEKGFSSQSQYGYSEGKECRLWAHLRKELYLDWDLENVPEALMLTWELKYEL